MRAPFSRSSITASVWPCCAATNSGVAPQAWEWRRGWHLGDDSETQKTPPFSHHPHLVDVDATTLHQGPQDIRMPHLSSDKEWGGSIPLSVISKCDQ